MFFATSERRMLWGKLLLAAPGNMVTEAHLQTASRIVFVLLSLLRGRYVLSLSNNGCYKWAILSMAEAMDIKLQVF